MARGINALFALAPFLDLDVNGAQQNGAGHWVADYTPGVANFITIDADANFGVPVVWGIASPGALPVGAANPMDADQYRIPTDNAANIVGAANTITVTATAGVIVQVIQIVLKPLVTALNVVANHYAFQDAAGRYAYDLSKFMTCRDAANSTSNLEVTTNPANAAAWSHVVWNAVDTANANAPYVLTNIDAQHKGIRLDALGTIKTSVTLVDSAQVMPAAVTLDVRSPAVNSTLANSLRIRIWSFDFAGIGRFKVTQENATNFNRPYEPSWKVSDPIKPPQGYFAGGALSLSNVRIDLLRRPSQRTTVHVRANVYFRHHNGNLTVVTTGSLNTNIYSSSLLTDHPNLGDLNVGNVPNEVMHNDPLLVFWEASDNGGVSWSPLEVTANTLYVTARAPVAATDQTLNVRGRADRPVYAYDSFLAISCTAAGGIAGGVGTANNVRNAISLAFALPANGNNTRMKRLNRGGLGPTQLGYWLDHQLGNRPAQSVNGGANIAQGGNLFNNPNGNIACGVWARMLMAMWAMHGKGDGRFIGVWSRTAGMPNILNNKPAALGNSVAATRFLVRNWDYNNHGNLNVNDYTHTIIAAIDAPPVPAGGANRAAPVNDGVAGQNNLMPPAQFGNHFIVRDGNGGDFFDPSYGTQALARDPWVDASIGGLRNDTTDVAGFVQNEAGSPNTVRANRSAVALVDFTNGRWIP